MAFEDAIAEILAQNRTTYQKQIYDLSSDQSSQNTWLHQKKKEIFKTLSENKAFIKKCNRKNRKKRKSFINVPLLHKKNLKIFDE